MTGSDQRVMRTDKSRENRRQDRTEWWHLQRRRGPRGCVSLDALASTRIGHDPVIYELYLAEKVPDP